MVATLRKRSLLAAPFNGASSNRKPELNLLPVKTKKLVRNATSESAASPSPSEYEKLREQRIKDNKERMQKLGILALKSQVFFPSRNSNKPYRSNKKPLDRSFSQSSEPSRRSSRLKTMAPVQYGELRVRKEELLRDIRISIPVGSKPEVYTQEHVELLGDCKEAWSLFVDGYEEDGERIYDSVNGKLCHQCRQKTIGHRTNCSKCNSAEGQLCGDCLYMGYGENVLEANKDSNWICPVCRGICNCGRCRRAKGWAPTGSLYEKVNGLGYKSVAHYLIQTRLAQEYTNAKTSLLSLDNEAQVKYDSCSDTSTEAGHEEHDSDGSMSSRDV